MYNFFLYNTLIFVMYERIPEACAVTNTFGIVKLYCKLLTFGREKKLLNQP